MSRRGTIVVVFTEATYSRLCEYLYKDDFNESMAIALYAKSECNEMTKLLVRMVRFPRPTEYLQRSPSAVSLQPDFMEDCFRLCENTQCHLLDIHTHPWTAHPSFSPIDDREALTKKIPYMRRWLPGTEIAFLLVGSARDRVVGRSWDGRSKKMDSIDQVQIM